MSPFDFIMAIVSVVLGLSLAELLQHIGQLVKRWERVRHDPIAWAFLVFATLVHFEFWFSLFKYQVHGSWNFLQFMLLVTPTLLIVMGVQPLVPDLPAHGPIHMRQDFEAAARKVYVIIFAIVPATALSECLLLGWPVFSAPNVVRLVGLVPLAWAIARPSRAAHAVATATLWLALVFFLETVTAVAQ